MAKKENTEDMGAVVDADEEKAQRVAGAVEALVRRLASTGGSADAVEEKDALVKALKERV